MEGKFPRLVLVALLAIVPRFACLPAWAGHTERVSVSSSGAQGDGDSGFASISADGRFVAFESLASNLVPGDTNATAGDPWSGRDVFVRDRLTGRTERVSVSSSGAQGNSWSAEPSVSADGRFVAFTSWASNLVPGDTNATAGDPWSGCDVFVRDRLTGRTERVSVSSSGAQGNDWSYSPSISADGRFVAFKSFASNLAPGDTNVVRDVFVRDRLTGTTERVSVSSSGAQGDGGSGFASISADGRFVAFESSASNLAPGDTNACYDVFVRDRLTRATERVSVSSSGAQGNSWSAEPSVSADGRFVAFASWASNLVPGDTNGAYDVFLRDRLTGTTQRVSVSSSGAQANGGSGSASISADGRSVAFESLASNLAPADTNGTWDAFVRDRLTGATERVSVSSSGAQGNSWSAYPSISADGRFVAFESWASNLVPGDTNGYPDVFVRDRLGYGGGPGTVPISPYPSGPWYLYPGQTHAHYKAERLLGIPLANDLTPNALAQLYRARGYSFMAATEHYPQYPLWTDPAQPSGILRLHHSMEDTCSTHILALGFTPWAGYPAANTCLFTNWARIQGILRGGGIAIAAHPNARDDLFGTLRVWSHEELGLLPAGSGGVEIYNRGAEIASLISQRWFGLPFALDKWDPILVAGKAVWGYAGDDFTLPQGALGGLDRGCIVAVLPGPWATQPTIMSALEGGAFYASNAGWRNGAGGPKILGYWADPAAKSVSVVTPSRPDQVWFVTSRLCGLRAAWQRPDGRWQADFSYDETRDRYVRAEVYSGVLFPSISWTQPIFIERLGMQTFTWQAPLAAAVRAEATPPLAVDFEGAHLEVSWQQPALAGITASLVSVADRPPASPPMGYVGNCYRFLPQANLTGTNYLSISYNPADIQLFREDDLSIYWYDFDQDRWAAVPSDVDPTAHKVTAEITTLGTFTLSAPVPPDSTRPVVTLTSPAPSAMGPRGPIIQQTPGPTTFTATATDDYGVAGVSFYLDDILLDKDIWPADGWSATTDLSRYPPGPHALKVVAEDAVGNEGQASAPLSITAGTPAPTLTISSPASGATFWAYSALNASGTWWDDENALEAAIGLDQIPLGAPTMTPGAWTFSTTVPPLAGAHLLTAAARDPYGNRASASVALNILAFQDVTPGLLFDRYIYALARAGVASGCSDQPLRYCPDATVTRGQIAKFICKAAGKTWLDRPTPTFVDVPKSNPFYGWVERLADAVSWGGAPPTTGCRTVGLARYFCPGDGVTRGQMAKLLCIARGKTWLAKATPTFSDVPTINQFYGWIERLADAASWGGTPPTSGCTPTTFCPDATVTRDQMAKFLCLAFGIPY
jgi:Tol biopolymer transport system component